jgi:VanZ family protein
VIALSEMFSRSGTRLLVSGSVALSAAVKNPDMFSGNAAPSTATTSVSLRAFCWPVLLMGMTFFASGQSQIAAPQIGGIDKFGHFVVYAWLGVLLVRIPVIAGLRPFGVWSAVIIASLYGLTDEFHQSFTPGRSVEIADWVTDTLGALTSVTLYTRWIGLRRWLEGAVLEPLPR